jgi:hypothetical protein
MDINKQKRVTGMIECMVNGYLGILMALNRKKGYIISVILMENGTSGILLVILWRRVNMPPVGLKAFTLVGMGMETRNGWYLTYQGNGMEHIHLGMKMGVWKCLVPTVLENELAFGIFGTRMGSSRNR